MQAVKRSVEEFADSTSRIIGCEMTVHSALGNGFQEVIYQRALELELGISGLKFIREMDMPIFYKGIEMAPDG